MQVDPFQLALHFVLDHEGGYSVDPRDPGGETKYGISKRAHPDLDIAALTPEAAAAIYRRDYWDSLGLGGLPPPLAIVTLDAAVNAGLHPAANFLQAAFNDLSPHKQISQDGVLGPQTRGAVSAWCGGDPLRHLAMAQRALARRGAFYAQLAKREKYRPFLRGWLTRVFELGDFLTQELAQGL